MRSSQKLWYLSRGMGGLEGYHAQLLKTNKDLKTLGPVYEDRSKRYKSDFKFQSKAMRETWSQVEELRRCRRSALQSRLTMQRGIDFATTSSGSIVSSIGESQTQRLYCRKHRCLFYQY